MKQPWELPLELLVPINKYGRLGRPKKRPRQRRMVEYKGELMSAARAGQLRRRDKTRDA